MDVLGSGYVLRRHHYPLHLITVELIRSFGGTTVSLLRDELAKAHEYLLRGAGQFVGYVGGRRASSESSKAPLKR
jgi:hypothetical protein